MEIISGIGFILIGAVLVGIGQRLSEEVTTLSVAVRKQVGVIRHRLAFPRRGRRASPNRLTRHDPALKPAAPVEQVIDQLRRGDVTDAEKQPLAAALLQDTPGSALPSIPEQPQPVPNDSAATAEALTLAVVATSAVKQVGERGVLAIRVTGIAIAGLGVVVLLLGIVHPFK